MIILNDTNTITSEDKIELPNHYDWNLPIKSKEVIDEVIKDLKGNIAFNIGNALKYIIRHNKKNGVEDLKKAKQYLEWTIEVLE